MMMTTRYAFLLLFLVIPTAHAFAPRPTTTRGATTHLKSVLEDSKLDPVDFDLNRAKQCAEHFGECSVEEMETLRDRLHKEHVQSFAMGHPMSTAVPEEAFEHRLLEEELSLQLSLLKEQMPTKPLFQSKTEAEDAFEDTMHHDQALKRAVEEVIQPSGDLLVTESKAMMMLDEETMEAAVVCLVIAAVALGFLQL